MIEKQYREFGLDMKDCANVDEFLAQVSNIGGPGGRPRRCNQIRKELDYTFAHINEQREALTTSFNAFKHLVFRIEVLKRVRQMIGEQEQRAIQDVESHIDSKALHDNLLVMKIMYLGGIIKAEDLPNFRRLIVRATRCQVYVHSYELQLSEEDQLVGDNFDHRRHVFVLAFQQGSIMEEKIRRICGSFSQNVFDINMDTISGDIRAAEEDKAHTRDIIRRTKTIFKDYLVTADHHERADVSVFKVYKMFILREKAIYLHLNMLKQGSLILQGLVWCPTSYNFEKKVGQMLQEKGLTGLNYEKAPKDFDLLTQPTYIKSNEFTTAAQMIVDTYGVPSYKEVNPAYFTTVTFPFFFGVMFGDIMHGAILFAFGLYLIFSSRKPGSFASMFSDLRYLFALMGLFSLFCGFIYNDYTSMSTKVFDSCYYEPEGQSGKVFAKQKEGCVYPLGFDPVWYISVQEITFLNSFKMKISVIYGVIQMMLGTFMKGFNAMYFKHWVELLAEVTTQVLLLAALFGFMDYLIIVKWTTDWETVTKGTNEIAPAIIQTMITMFIQGGVKDNSKNLGAPQADVIPNQTETMQLMLIIAGLCVPVMLLIKPIFEILALKKHAKTSEEQALVAKSSARREFDQLASYVVKPEHPHGAGEIFIHQMIETIEYVLGTVSNTASYLRLWALSLAHGQLAKVFFEYTVGSQLRGGNYVALFLAFYVFFGVSFGVLMCMDLMEAFLHVLRLHWVEFQSKFYKGQGYLFKPFSFERVFSQE